MVKTVCHWKHYLDNVYYRSGGGGEQCRQLGGILVQQQNTILTISNYHGMCLYLLTMFVNAYKTMAVHYE